jgi:Ssp1 endopeptidase immunity protein Rap1a
LAVLIAAIVAFIVWTVAVASPLWKAEDIASAKFVLPSCKLRPVEAFINPTAAYLHGRCIGTLESILFMTDVLAKQEPSLCTKIPAGTTPGQIRDVVIKYAEEHPDQANNDFRRFVYSALHEAWPCR